MSTLNKQDDDQKPSNAGECQPESEERMAKKARTTPSDEEPIKGEKGGKKAQPVDDGGRMILLVRTSQCMQFKALLECLKELLTEVNMEFIEDKGMRLVAIDPGNVAMVHLEVNAIEYFFAKETVTAGMDVSFLYKIIRCMTSGDLMTWKIYEDEPHVMHIELANSDRRTTTTNKLKLLDLEEVNIRIPPVDYQRVVSMPSSDLAKYVREMVTISNTMSVKGTRDTLEFYADGKMASSHITVRPTSAGLNWRHETNSDPIEGKFFVKYIEKFVKVSVDTTVELFLKQDFPLVFRYELSIGTLRFVIAPIVD